MVDSLRYAKSDLGDTRHEPPPLSCRCGHAHLDYVQESEGISHVQINTASYVWVSTKHPNDAPEIQKAHPWVAAPCPYADPLLGPGQL